MAWNEMRQAEARQDRCGGDEIGQCGVGRVGLFVEKEVG